MERVLVFETRNFGSIPNMTTMLWRLTGIQVKRMPIEKIVLLVPLGSFSSSKWGEISSTHVCSFFRSLTTSRTDLHTVSLLVLSSSNFG